MHTKILKIRSTPSDNELELRIMFLTGLALSLEGEEDREAILIEAATISESTSHSEAAATTMVSEGLLQ